MLSQQECRTPVQSDGEDEEPLDWDDIKDECKARWKTYSDPQPTTPYPYNRCINDHYLKKEAVDPLLTKRNVEWDEPGTPEVPIDKGKQRAIPEVRYSPEPVLPKVEKPVKRAAEESMEKSQAPPKKKQRVRVFPSKKDLFQSGPDDFRLWALDDHVRSRPGELPKKNGYSTEIIYLVAFALDSVLPATEFIDAKKKPKPIQPKPTKAVLDNGLTYGAEVVKGAEGAEQKTIKRTKENFSTKLKQLREALLECPTYRKLADSYVEIRQKKTAMGNNRDSPKVKVLLDRICQFCYDHLERNMWKQMEERLPWGYEDYEDAIDYKKIRLRKQGRFEAVLPTTKDESD